MKETRSLAVLLGLGRRGVTLGIVLFVTVLMGVEYSAADQLDQVQELLDAQRLSEATQLLDRFIDRDPKSARAFLLRSTARFLEGRTAEGRKDLNRALKLDPNLRQAWLNRAGLDLAEQNYDGAFEALLRAQEIDPSAPENELNLGAVLLFQGDIEQSSERFTRYLSQNPKSAEASFLVASNYSIAGFSGLAIQHLRRAIALDERSRVRARTDPNFVPLEASPQYLQLLSQDTFVQPPGAYVTALKYKIPFSGDGPNLIDAVVDALQFSNRPFDHRIEVTDNWALLWSEIRIKVVKTADGYGEVQLSAPPTRFTPTEWKARSDEFLRQVTIQSFARRKGVMNFNTPG
jgi:tetratricopeptide (TPR) repeat protein